MDVQSKADFLENEARDDISVGSVGRRLNSIVSLELLFTSKTKHFKMHKYKNNHKLKLICCYLQLDCLLLYKL